MPLNFGGTGLIKARQLAMVKIRFGESFGTLIPFLDTR